MILKSLQGIASNKKQATFDIKMHERLNVAVKLVARLPG